jgi:8-oxo-dGTP pyrophosphatase MutT (NUDIX family)
MIVKHATASVFVFRPDPWQLGLIEHPRLGRWMVPGGHVEVDETQDQAALREVTEESGRTVRLINPPMPEVPAGFPHLLLAAPWWITEQDVPADNHLAVPHVHVDHQYVALVDDSVPVSAPAHPFQWVDANDLAGLPMFEDTRLLATVLFSCIGDIAAGGLDPTSLLRPFAAAAV